MLATLRPSVLATIHPSMSAKLSVLDETVNNEIEEENTLSRIQKFCLEPD